MGGKRATIRIASWCRGVMIIAAKIVVRKRTDLKSFLYFSEVAVNEMPENISFMEVTWARVGPKNWYAARRSPCPILWHNVSTANSVGLRSCPAFRQRKDKITKIWARWPVGRPLWGVSEVGVGERPH